MSVIVPTRALVTLVGLTAGDVRAGSKEADAFVTAGGGALVGAPDTVALRAEIDAALYDDASMHADAAAGLHVVQEELVLAQPPLSVAVNACRRS